MELRLKRKKYIITILMILFIFILSIAKVEYAKAFDMSKLPNVVCTNRGWLYSKYDSNYQEVQAFKIRNETSITPKEWKDGAKYGLNLLDIPGNEINHYKLAYIFSNVKSPRNSIGGSATQVAVWEMIASASRIP